ncbi:MAG: hypothetical protein ACYC4L_10080 [Chloroflexota bacterium]
MAQPPRRPWRVERHHRQTESRLVLGGFAVLVLLGGGLVWQLYGPLPGLIAVAIILGAGLVFALLLLLLRALDAWARSSSDK